MPKTKKAKMLFSAHVNVDPYDGSEHSHTREMMGTSLADIKKQVIKEYGEVEEMCPDDEMEETEDCLSFWFENSYSTVNVNIERLKAPSDRQVTIAGVFKEAGKIVKKKYRRNNFDDGESFIRTPKGFAFTFKRGWMNKRGGCEVSILQGEQGVDLHVELSNRLDKSELDPKNVEKVAQQLAEYLLGFAQMAADIPGQLETLGSSKVKQPRRKKLPKHKVKNNPKAAQKKKRS